MSIPVNLSLCGVDLKIQGIDNAMLEVEAKLAELTSGAKGLAGNLEKIKGDIQAKMAAMQAEMESLIPDIKPELPNLQAEMNGLLGQLSSPLGFSSQLASIQKKFGNIPGVDIDSLVGELKSNPLGFDPCKAVPNIDVEETVDEDGAVIFVPIRKGLPPEVPVVDAKKLPTPPEAKKTEDVTPAPDASVAEKTSLEVKQLGGSSVPPPTNPVVKSGKTITVPTPPLLQAVHDALDKAEFSRDDIIRGPFVFTAGTQGRNKSGTFEEGGAEFWKPNLFPTQLAFEEYVVQSLYGKFSLAVRRIKAIEQKSPEELQRLLAAAPDQFSKSNMVAVREAIIAFIRNGLPRGAGNDGGGGGTFSIVGTRPTVSAAQAQRSAVPKPDGGFGKFSVLV